MTGPQVWVRIGVFAAAVLGMMSWQTVCFNRNLRISVDGRLDSVESKIDGLDRDVQTLTRHVFGPDGR